MAEEEKFIRTNIGFDQISLKNLDAICKELDQSRGQIIRMVFSGDEKKIDFVLETMRKINKK